MIVNLLSAIYQGLMEKVFLTLTACNCCAFYNVLMFFSSCGVISMAIDVCSLKYSALNIVDIINPGGVTSLLRILLKSEYNNAF